MKLGALSGALLALVCMSCSSGTQDLRLESKIVNDTLPAEYFASFQLSTYFLDSHFGEYAHAISPHQIVSVEREKTKQADPGIMSFDFSTQRRQLLHPNLTQAKDLHLLRDLIFYRVDNQIFVKPTGGNAIVLGDSTTRLIGVQELEEAVAVYILDGNKESKRLCVSKDELSHLSTHDILAEILYVSPSSKERDSRVFWKNRQGLHLAQMQRCDSPPLKVDHVQDGQGFSYLKAFRYQDSDFIAYLNQPEGNFELLRLSSDGGWSSERIDGKDFEDFVGMDWIWFQDGTRPGFIYLDAWNLKPKVAIFRDGAWKAYHLPFSGAGGFYNVLMSQQDKNIRFAFHSFRYRDSENLEDYFENLHLGELVLK